jgi:hypothetical protein
MKKLSDQLSDLSARAKKTEDVVAAAKDKNRAKLETERTSLKTAVDKQTADLADKADGAKSKWEQARASVDAHFTAVRADADARHFEKDVKKAERRADQAEDDAADAIEYALYVLDQTDYLISDAVIARADADSLVLEG